MLKKSLTFMLVGGFIATSSYAFQPFELSKKIKPVTTHTQKQARSEKYTDFSGSWTGSCGLEGSELETITIKNDDLKLSLGDEDFSIGGSLKTTTFSDSMSTYFDHMSFFWNEDRSQLIGSGLFAGKTVYRSDSEYPISSATVQFAMSIKDDKLIVEGKNKVYLGVEEDATENFTCTYARDVY